MTVVTNGAPVAPAAPKPNGATVQPATAQPAPTQPDAAALQRERDEYRQKAESLDKKLRVNSIEMMKFADEKKGIGAKLSEHSAFDSAFKAAGLTAQDLRDFKINPEPALKKVFGDGWWDKLVEMRINGGAPTAATVASEISRAKDEMRAELEAERKAQQESAEKAKRESMEAARAELVGDASRYLKEAWAEFPIFEGYQPAQVARAIAQHQEAEWQRTGKVLTTKEAAEALESAEISRAERVAGIPKYASRLTEKLKPANVPPVVGSRSAGSTQQQSERRTLSNDLTATTPGTKRTPRTDEERMAAIKALDLAGLKNS